MRETRESTRWNLDEPRTKDEERPPREEWPTAMKILTGTMPGPRRPPESVFLLLFLSLSLSFFLRLLLLYLLPSRSLSCCQRPSPSLRERFTEAAYKGRLERLRRPARRLVGYPLDTKGFEEIAKKAMPRSCSRKRECSSRARDE